MIGKPSFSMVELDVKKEFVPIAKKKAKEMGSLKDSITKGKGNTIAFIGEQVVTEYHSGKWVNEQGVNYDYDVILDGWKVDVKATSTNVRPLSNYLAKVSASNTRQKCDYYYFARVLYDHSKIWLVGYMERDEFFAKATYYKKGDLDPSSDTGWTFPASCYVMELKDLKPINGKVFSDKRGIVS